MWTNEIVSQAISFIMNNIEKEITIEDVANACHFSKFYFSRILKEATGESIYAFIKRMKLEQSAFRMKIEKDRTITEIGLDYGYEASNYSQAFRKYYDTTPIKFRNAIYDKSKTHPFYSDVKVELETFEVCKQKVRIETLKDQRVIYERRIGNYRELAKDWVDFTEKYEKHRTEQSVYIERTFDDPSITEPDKCIYDLCMTVDEQCDCSNVYTIPGGKFAIYHYQGYKEQIYNAYQTMFQVWIPQMHLRIDNRYGFDIYREIKCDVLWMDMDICIPICDK